MDGKVSQKVGKNTDHGRSPVALPDDCEGQDTKRLEQLSQETLLLSVDE